MNVRKNLADFSSELQRDRLTVRDIRVVVVHLGQRHDFLEKPAGRIVSVMVNQFPRFRDVATGIGADVRHVSHCVEKVRFAIYFADCTS